MTSGRVSKAVRRKLETRGFKKKNLTVIKRLQDDPSTRDLTTEEIKARDEDNLRLLLDASKRYYFDDLNGAIAFMREAFGRAMTRLGCPSLVPERVNQAQIEILGEEEMTKNDVRIENRHSTLYPNMNDKWKGGFYLYHGGEIAYFISNPFQEAPSGLIIVPGPLRFTVRTNAPDEYSKIAH